MEEPDGAETGERPSTLRLPDSRVSQEITEDEEVKEITENEEVKEITENTIVTCNCGVCIIDVDIGLRVIGNKQTIYT